MKFESLNALLLLKIEAIYDIESKIIDALPAMIKNATDKDLKAALDHHLEETKEQKGRLEEIFQILEVSPKKTKVEGIRGIITDAEWLMDQDMSSEAMDASIIGAARHVEYYEMAGYMTAIEWAELLGLEDVVDLLQSNLEEEQEAEEKLAEVAESSVNESVMKVA